MDGRVLVFSHEQDVDGLLSAAVLKIAFPGAEIVLTNYGLDRMLAVREKIMEALASAAGVPAASLANNDKGFDNMIILADIGVNEESYSPVLEALRHSKQAGWKNVWIDHHLWPEGPRERLSQVCEMVIFAPSITGTTSKKCAAELCADRFAPSSLLARQLAAIAHRTDFPDSAKFPIPPLTALISYYLGFQDKTRRLYSVILENVVRGVLWNTEMQDDIIEASRLIDESMARSMQGMVVREFAPGYGDGDYGKKAAEGGRPLPVIKVAIARSDPFVSRSMLLGRIMDDIGADIAIAFTEDGKVSIRRKENSGNSSHSSNDNNNDDGGANRKVKLSCSEIAQQLKEGGGHEGAAGGFLRSVPDDFADKQAGDRAAVEEIVSTLQAYFEKQNNKKAAAAGDGENSKGAGVDSTLSPASSPAT